MEKYRRKSVKKQRGIIIASIICLTFIMVTAYSAFSTKLSIGAKGNVVDRSQVIQSWTNSSNEDFHTDFYRENIISVTFLDSAKVPEGVKDKWDVSVNKDKGVMAYVVESSSETGKYDLFIGAKDGVIANENSSNLFHAFSNLKKIEFNNNYDTSNATNMAAMFHSCKSLTDLDLSSFYTSNVINMYAMFADCTSLTGLNITSFDTSKVTTMNNMFGSCTSISELDLSNFNTSNVSDMRGMFYGCTNLSLINLSSFNTYNTTNMRAMFMSCGKLAELNLCNFDTSNVTTMQDMFYGTTSLSKIMVSNKWVTTNVANMANMFYESGVSSVTTGQCES